MVDLKQLRIQYLTDDAGERVGVVLPLSDFEELVEDVEDLAIVAERRDEATLSHNELLAELKRDGLI